MKLGTSLTQEAAEGLAIQALTFIAEDPERLGRFLAVTGIGPAEIRLAAREPGFLAGVLEHLAGDERLLTAFAADADVDPADIGKALATLSGGAWERESP
jgi:Protein of unknown function (DUF3572)